MSGVAVCTCVAANFVAFARVLADSFQRFHPDIPFFVVVGDRREPQSVLGRESVRALGIDHLGIPELSGMLLRYDCKQVMVALKPAVLRHLLEQGFDTVLYLDPDTLVTAPLDSLIGIAQQHSLTLTPHVGPKLAEESDEQREKTLLYAGIFNGGVVGANNREETLRFLAWWERRLRTHCVEEVRLGLHFDQRWLDLAPGFVWDLYLLRDPAYNAAYWNLPDFQVCSTPEGLVIADAPLRLFHFSGYSPEQPDVVTKYLPGLAVSDLGDAATLFREYATLLRRAGWGDTSRDPWAWDSWRRLWRQIRGHWRRYRPYRPY